MMLSLSNGFTLLSSDKPRGTKKDKRMQMFLLLSLILYIDMPTYILNLDCMGMMIRIWVQTYCIVGAFHEKLNSTRADFLETESENYVCSVNFLKFEFFKIIQLVPLFRYTLFPSCSFYKNRPLSRETCFLLCFDKKTFENFMKILLSLHHISRVFHVGIRRILVV